MSTPADRGTTAVEFGLLLAAVAVSVLSVAVVVGRLAYDALSGAMTAVGG